MTWGTPTLILCGMQCHFWVWWRPMISKEKRKHRFFIQNATSISFCKKNKMEKLKSALSVRFGKFKGDYKIVCFWFFGGLIWGYQGMMSIFLTKCGRFSFFIRKFSRKYKRVSRNFLVSLFLELFSINAELGGITKFLGFSDDKYFVFFCEGRLSEKNENYVPWSSYPFE